MKSNPLHVWTIYERPRDYPQVFVVRRFVIDGPQERPDPKPWAVADTLEAARAAIPRNLFCVRREPADDPVIVESWL